MSGPKNHNDKSLHGLSVGLGIAGTIAATVIVFAYAAGDGFLYPAPELPSVDTTAAANGPALPVADNSDIKQELQLAQDKVQDQAKLADKIAIEQRQVQQTSEVVEMQESVNIDKVGYVPAVEDKSDEPSSPAKHNEAQDPIPPANNDENELPPLPTLPSLDDKEGENNGNEEQGVADHHEKGGAKEHKDKKHDSHDDSIASIAFKSDKHHKDD